MTKQETDFVHLDLRTDWTSGALGHPADYANET